MRFIVTEVYVHRMGCQSISPGIISLDKQRTGIDPRIELTKTKAFSTHFAHATVHTPPSVTSIEISALRVKRKRTKNSPTSENKKDEKKTNNRMNGHPVRKERTS